MYPKNLGIFITIVLLLAACNPAPTATPSVVPSEPSGKSSDATQASESGTPKKTTPPNVQAAPTIKTDGIAPYPDAPLCLDSGESHDNSLFHTLWDSTRGCHYDHEHGQDPFTPEVAATFPDLHLMELAGHVGIGHTNPSSPKENTHKHGGFKWQVLLEHPLGCEGYQGSKIGVSASVIQYHNLGDYAMEFEARVHSALALLRQCRTDNPTDYGYVYVVQHVDYGQRVVPYQGVAMPYPDAPS